MPIQVDSYSSAAQLAVTNPIQQRQDQVRIDSRKDDEQKTKTKPAGTAAAEGQQTESKRNNVVNLAQASNNSQSQQSTQRGSLVNISV